MQQLHVPALSLSRPHSASRRRTAFGRHQLASSAGVAWGLQHGLAVCEVGLVNQHAGPLAPQPVPSSMQALSKLSQ